MVDSVFPIAVIFAKLPRVDGAIMQARKMIPTGQASRFAALACEHVYKPAPTASASHTGIRRGA